MVNNSLARSLIVLLGLTAGTSIAKAQDIALDGANIVLDSAKQYPEKRAAYVEQFIEKHPVPSFIRDVFYTIDCPLPQNFEAAMGTSAEPVDTLNDIPRYDIAICDRAFETKLITSEDEFYSSLFHHEIYGHGGPARTNASLPQKYLTIKNNPSELLSLVVNELYAYGKQLDSLPTLKTNDEFNYYLVHAYYQWYSQLYSAHADSLDDKTMLERLRVDLFRKEPLLELTMWENDAHPRPIYLGNWLYTFEGPKRPSKELESKIQHILHPK